MTLARYIMSRSLGFAVVTKVYAVSSGALACGLPVSLDGLYDVNRKSAGAVTIVRYIRKESPYIYKTSFDTRTVTVAAGSDPLAVNEVAGVSSGNRGMEVRKTLLVVPPYTDQIVERHFSRGVRHHRNWAVWREEIRYGAQGRSDGYTIDCATAYKVRRHAATAVSECFSLEDWPRFLGTLDSLDKAIEDPGAQGAGK